MRFPFQAMSTATNDSHSSGVGSHEIDRIQFLIDQFDSDDAMTSAGVAGVDEDIIEELLKRGHAVKGVQVDPMHVGIYYKNRGGVIGNSCNLTKITDDVTKLGWSWKECSHALCMKLASGDTTTEDAYRIWC